MGFLNRVRASQQRPDMRPIPLSYFYKIIEVAPGHSIDEAAKYHPEVPLWVYIGNKRYREASLREVDEYFASERKGGN